MGFNREHSTVLERWTDLIFIPQFHGLRGPTSTSGDDEPKCKDGLAVARVLGSKFIETAVKIARERALRTGDYGEPRK